MAGARKVRHKLAADDEKNKKILPEPNKSTITEISSVDIFIYLFIMCIKHHGKCVM